MKLKRFILFLSIIFVLGSIFTPFVSANGEVEEEINIVAIGDSITYGWNLEDNQAPSFLAFPNKIWKGNTWSTCYCLPGITSSFVVNNWFTSPQNDFDLEEDFSDADLVTLNIGSNDLLQAAGIGGILESGTPVIPTPELIQKVTNAGLLLGHNLQTIVTEIRKHTDAPIILYNIYNPFGASEDPFAASLHALGEQIVTNVNNNIIRPVSLYHSDILYADAYTAYNGRQADYIIPGDIHPNADGHEVLGGIGTYLLIQSGFDPSNPTEPVIQGWHQENGNWYYLDENGYVQTGWLLDGQTWYYLAEDGVMQTGWVLDKGKWYFMSKTGAIQTGWVLDKNTWYYMSDTGAMQTGWVLDKGKWYYMSDSGAMQTGWVLDKGTWYYMSDTGAMQTGWILDKGAWYFMSGTGAMQTGWVLDKGKWYYLYANGKMASKTTINGYVLGESGAWIN